MKKIILCLSVLFAAVSLMSSEIINLSNLPASSSTHPRLIAQDSKIMVVWREEGGHNGVEKNIYFTTYHAGCWNTPKAAYNTTVISKNPHITPGPKGEIHLAWADGPGSNREVYYGVFRDGAWQGTPEKILASPYNSNWIKIQQSDEGNILTAWASAMEPGITDWWTVRCNWKKNGKWNPTGKTLSTNTMNTGEKNLAMYPQFVYRDGISYVIWPQADTTGSQIMYIDNASGTWTTPRAITPKGTYTWPGLAVDSSGGVHVICSKTGGKVWYTHRPPGGKWNTLEPVNQDVKHQRGFTTLAIDKNDGLHAVYQGGPYIYHSYRPYCENWKPEIQISQGTGDRFPALDIDSDGNVHIAWSSGDEGEPSDIFYHTFKTKDFYHVPDTDPDTEPDDPKPVEPEDPEPGDPKPEPQKHTLWDFIISMYNGGAFGSVVDFDKRDGITMKDYYARFPIAVISSKVDAAFLITSDSRWGFSLGIHGNGIHLDIGPSWSFIHGTWKPQLHFGICIPRKK